MQPCSQPAVIYISCCCCGNKADLAHVCLVRRQEGIYTTAKAVHDRLEQLVGSRGSPPPDSGEAAAEVTSLFSWQASARRHTQKQLLVTASLDVLPLLTPARCASG